MEFTISNFTNPPMTFVSVTLKDDGPSNMATLVYWIIAVGKGSI
jgi:hypothetical protein